VGGQDVKDGVSAPKVFLMTAEFIAIIVTGAFQSVLLLIGLWMSYRLGKILERIEGVTSATFLDARTERAALKTRLDEIHQMVREDLLKR